MKIYQHDINQLLIVFDDDKRLLVTVVGGDRLELTANDPTTLNRVEEVAKYSDFFNLLSEDE